jgi:hypothetical protein
MSVPAHMGLKLGRPWPPAVWPEFQWDTIGQLHINYKPSIMYPFRVAEEAISGAYRPRCVALRKRAGCAQGDSARPGQEGAPSPPAERGRVASWGPP